MSECYSKAERAIMAQMDRCAAIRDENAQLRAQLAEYRELLEDAARQWGIAVTRDGKPGLSTGGLSTLEDIFAALGWDDPHMLTEPYTDPNRIGPDTYAVSATDGEGKG